MSLPGHAQYAALVDLPAAGFSGRLPFLLGSGRPLIVVDRPQEQWFYWSDDGMRPWVHYVPSRPHTAELAKAWEWIRSYPEAAKAMALRAQSYVLYNLSTERLVCRFATRPCPASACMQDIAGSGAPSGFVLHVMTLDNGVYLCLPFGLLLLLPALLALSYFVMRRRSRLRSTKMAATL